MAVALTAVVKDQGDQDIVWETERNVKSAALQASKAGSITISLYSNSRVLRVQSCKPRLRRRGPRMRLLEAAAGAVALEALVKALHVRFSHPECVSHSDLTVMSAARQASFAETGHTMRLLEAAAAAVALTEPVLLVGEAGTGKTALMQHLAQKVTS